MSSGILTFSKRLLSNSLPPGKNVRSNITKFPTPRNDLWSRARTKIQISLPPGQQENSNALPPGQSDRSKSRPAGLTLIVHNLPTNYSHIWRDRTSTRNWPWSQTINRIYRPKAKFF